MSIDRRPEPPPPGSWRQGDGSASSFGAGTVPSVVLPVEPAPVPPPVVEPPATRLRLAELEPAWYTLEEGGPRVGLTFLCPHCREIHLAVAFHHHGQEGPEDGYIRAHYPNNPDLYIWDLGGQEDFNTLTLFPSVDASASGHWHGSIIGGWMV